MSTSHAIITTIEILVVLAVLLGLIYEPFIAEWEQKQGEKMLKRFKERKKYRK